MFDFTEAFFRLILKNSQMYKSLPLYLNRNCVHVLYAIFKFDTKKPEVIRLLYYNEFKRIIFS